MGSRFLESPQLTPFFRTSGGVQPLFEGELFFLSRSSDITHRLIRSSKVSMGRQSRRLGVATSRSELLLHEDGREFGLWSLGDGDMVSEKPVVLSDEPRGEGPPNELRLQEEILRCFSKLNPGVNVFSENGVFKA